MSRTLVLVEAPTKAKTISKYLPYDVMATNGHIRDLPSKNGSVDPSSDFSMVWEFDEKGKKTVFEISKAVKGVDKLILATDPDREGEAIAWHIKQVLEDKKLLRNVNVERIVFHEITKSAVMEALSHPRDINQDLVDAYLARRALDYLFGFTLSPVLWRKLPGARSAGRVQSVALRLIVDKEQDILKFKSEEFWTIEGIFLNNSDEQVKTKLIKLFGEKLEKFSIKSKEEADEILKKLTGLEYKVSNVESKEVSRQPSAPFMTSTLQQEASRKLGFSVSKTMKVAQRLYEGVSIKGELTGLISYMRTDSVHLSDEALKGIRSVIKKDYGEKYLPKDIRSFKNKVKNAQEAHEGIRPTIVELKPQDIENELDDDQFKLYSLIWKRTIASQMSNSISNQVSVDIAALDNIFHASGSTVVFDGFLKVYKEDKDEIEDQDEGNIPLLKLDETLKVNKIFNVQHFTQPPSRYTEASLIKKLEELGIGRPSTYASLIQVLKDRSYVYFEKKHFVPEGIGFLLVQFLIYTFENYVKYDFTADMEEKLDTISSGDSFWKDILGEFWNDFSKNIEKSSPLRISEVIDYLEKELSTYLFPDGRVCPVCKTGSLGLRLGKYGAFLGCNNYPDCRNTKQLFKSEENFQEVFLGKDETTGQDIFLKKGPFGFYIELSLKDKQPKRIALPSSISIEKVDLNMASFIASLPKVLGKHPKTNEEIQVGIGKFGPYIKYLDKFKSISKKFPEFWNLTLDEAIKILD